VLDDNKKLCLSSGEIMKLTERQRMMFEVGDLAVASPATVSRCGMVYLDARVVGLPPLFSAWLKSNIPPVRRLVVCSLPPSRASARSALALLPEDVIILIILLALELQSLILQL
jgi:hypothetical protein